MIAIGTVTLTGQAIILRRSRGAELELPLVCGDLTEEVTREELRKMVKRHWPPGVSLGPGRQEHGGLTVITVIERRAAESIEAAVLGFAEAAS